MLPILISASSSFVAGPACWFVQVQSPTIDNRLNRKSSNTVGGQLFYIGIAYISADALANIENICYPQLGGQPVVEKPFRKCCIKHGQVDSLIECLACVDVVVDNAVRVHALPKLTKVLTSGCVQHSWHFEWYWWVLVFVVWIFVSHQQRNHFLLMFSNSRPTRGDKLTTSFWMPLMKLMVVLQITSNNLGFNFSFLMGKKRKSWGWNIFWLSVLMGTVVRTRSWLIVCAFTILSLVYRTLINVNRLRKLKLSKSCTLGLHCAHTPAWGQGYLHSAARVGVVYNRLELGYQVRWCLYCIAISGFIYPVDRSGWREKL